MLQINEVRCGIFTYGNDRMVEMIYPDNCCKDEQAAPVPVVVEKGVYKSYISTADANSFATAWILQNGQRIANLQGQCLDFTYLEDIRLGSTNDLSASVQLPNYSPYCAGDEYFVVGGSEVNAKVTISGDTLTITRNPIDFVGTSTVDYTKICGNNVVGKARIFVDFKYSQNCSTFVKTTC